MGKPRFVWPSTRYSGAHTGSETPDGALTSAANGDIPRAGKDHQFCQSRQAPPVRSTPLPRHMHSHKPRLQTVYLHEKRVMPRSFHVLCPSIENRAGILESRIDAQLDRESPRKAVTRILDTLKDGRDWCQHNRVDATQAAEIKHDFQRTIFGLKPPAVVAELFTMAADRKRGQLFEPRAPSVELVLLLHELGVQTPGNELQHTVGMCRMLP